MRPRVAACVLAGTLAPGLLAVRVPAPASEEGFRRGAAAGAPAAPAYREGELLVTFHAGARAAAPLALADERGDRVVRRLAQGRVAQVRVAPGRTTAQALAEYAADPKVAWVQPNYLYRALGVPNDPQYAQLWALANTGQRVAGATYAANNPGTPGRDLRVEQAWDLATDCRRVTVAVIDSGVNYTHRDLAAAMWDGAAAGYPRHGYDFVDDDDDPMPSDGSGHGTHVAATIGAVGNNGIGVAGVCWQSSLMAIRALDGAGGTTASVVAGVEFAVAHGAKIVNLSLGGSAFDPLLGAAIAEARSAGVLVVAAAGNDGLDNDGGTPGYPCNFTHDNIVCVAALDQAYQLASFSNYGAASVDLGAPGTNTLSAWPGERLTDDLATGWTAPDGGWAAVRCDFGLGTLPMLVNPPDWCRFGTYTGPLDQAVYKSFDLAGLLGAGLSYHAFLDVGAADRFEVAASAAPASPFAGGGRVLGTFSGSTGSRAVPFAHALDDCLSSSCTIGFRLSAASGSSRLGAGILRLSIDTVQVQADRYAIANGTSMAAPHVSGVAALVWSYNPDYRLEDVVRAVEHGGEPVPALAGRTATGCAASAWGSLRHIAAPTGLVAAPP